MKVEYLIVGQGIGGSVFSRILEEENRSFVVLDHKEENSSSHAAAGIMNPITGKRMVKTWLADDVFPFAFQFYEAWQKELGASFVHSKKILRIFQTLSDQNDLLAKAGEDDIESYLKFCDASTLNKEIIAPHGAFEIQQGGYLKVNNLLDAFSEHLLKLGKLKIENFIPEDLTRKQGIWKYKDIEADKVVLAQGHQALNNHYFNWLPFHLTKGELLKVKAKGLNTDHILSKGCLLLPETEDEFWLGASYDKKIDKTYTEKAEAHLRDKFSKMVDVPFSVIDKRVGIRPTTRDRRPFVGKHPEKENLYIFNGLGTKGVTLAPYFAKELLNYINHGTGLNSAASIERASKYYPKES